MVRREIYFLHTIRWTTLDIIWLQFIIRTILRSHSGWTVCPSVCYAIVFIDWSSHASLLFRFWQATCVYVEISQASFVILSGASVTTGTSVWTAEISGLQRQTENRTTAANDWNTGKTIDRLPVNRGFLGVERVEIYVAVHMYAVHLVGGLNGRCLHLSVQKFVQLNCWRTISGLRSA